MYAIIKTGGKQYRVEVGDFINVELLHAEKNSQVEFNEVLYMSNGTSIKIGNPSIPGLVVRANVVEGIDPEMPDEKEGIRGPKVIAYRYKRRKRCERKKGHRQNYSRVQITEIAG